MTYLDEVEVLYAQVSEYAGLLKYCINDLDYARPLEEQIRELDDIILLAINILKNVSDIKEAI